jgi:GTP-binding protein HflX
MSQELSGNLKGLAPSELKALNKLFGRRVNRSEIISFDLSREILDLATALNRQIGLLIGRDGKVAEVVIGTKDIIYLPDLGRYRVGQGRLRRLRLVYTDLTSGDELKIKPDIYTDLAKLRLDAVIAVKSKKNRIGGAYAYILPPTGKSSSSSGLETEYVADIGDVDLDFLEFIEDIEQQLNYYTEKTHVVGKTNAILVGVYGSGTKDIQSSIDELKELARTANVHVLDTIIQKRTPDPKTLLGKGKLEEVVLHCLKLGAEMVIFDCELKPNQWRSVTNSTELRVIDRSMLILDIFAQRANSSEGRLQVELAQLKYNLPRLVETDSGLSRLSGGIGGRGPGETKLELGRRRIRDKIVLLEGKIEKIGAQRDLRRKQRSDNMLPVVAILGYTNVGKSTLFNKLTSSAVLAENKLFATLDPAHRRLRLPSLDVTKNEAVILTDTVGFIRELPAELMTAFKATLDELNEAVLFLHILDASDLIVEERKKAVEKILSEMNLTDTPTVIVLNKCDKADPEKVEALVNEYSAVPVSAIEGKGLADLLDRVVYELSAREKRLKQKLKEVHGQGT